MKKHEMLVATPFLCADRDFPYVGYDCGCKAPSVYREVRDAQGAATIFSLCPVCDNLPQQVASLAWGEDINFGETT